MLLPLVAVTVTSVVLVTVVVVTVNVAVVAPAGTVTPGGVDAAVEPAESDTATPPPGAGALSVTVPVEEAPPITLDGLSVIDINVTVAAKVYPDRPTGLDGHRFLHSRPSVARESRQSPRAWSP